MSTETIRLIKDEEKGIAGGGRGGRRGGGGGSMEVGDGRHESVYLNGFAGLNIRTEYQVTMSTAELRALREGFVSV